MMMSLMRTWAGHKPSLLVWQLTWQAALLAPRGLQEDWEFLNQSHRVTTSVNRKAGGDFGVCLLWGQGALPLQELRELIPCIPNCIYV